MPIYKGSLIAEEKQIGATRLVEAKTPAQAIRYLAKTYIKLETVTPKEALQLGRDGLDLEDATKEPDPAEPGEPKTTSDPWP